MSFTESSSQASDEEQIILVLNPVNNEPEEVVVSGDNTLELSTLDHAFPGAYGLKFINKSSNRQQYVNFDENKKAFLAPRGGWKGTTFNLVFKDRSERKGHLYKQVEKKPFFSDEPDHLPSFEYMQKFLFYIKEENFNTCVACVGSRFFVTYQHNTHRTYKDEDSIRVYSYDGTTVYDTVVCFIDEKFDLILLESSTKILDRVPISKDYKKKEGSKLKMIGKSSEDNTPCCVYGYLVMRGSFMVGKMDSSFVECGTPVFDMHGLYGIYIARLDLFDSSYEYDTENDKYFEILILPVGELNVYMGYIRSKELAKYGLGPPQGVLVLDGVVYS